MNETLKKPKKCIPTVASFTTVHEYTKDPLVIAKLQVFISTAQIVKPFSKKYQTDKLMLPFLAADLHVVLCNLLSRFVKESILIPLKATRIVGVDVTEKSWLPIDFVDCGFAAK